MSGVKVKAERREAQKYLHKGTRIVIGGRISTGNYKDKDGKTIYTTDVILSLIHILI